MGGGGGVKKSGAFRTHYRRTASLTVHESGCCCEVPPRLVWGWTVMFSLPTMKPGGIETSEIKDSWG